MTADAPAATTYPLRFVQPVVAALASAGVITHTARQLYGYPLILPDISVPLQTWLAPITAVLMLTATAAVVAMRPSLARACGWPIVIAGLGLVALIAQTPLLESGGDSTLVWFLVVVAASAAALGGVIVVAAHAPAAEQVAIAAGVAFGVATRSDSPLLWIVKPGLNSPTRMLPAYIVIGLALVAAAMAFTRPITLDATRRGFTAFVPVLAVTGVSGMIQLGHYARNLVLDVQISDGGPPSPQVTDIVTAFAEYTALALALVAGALLLWLGYRRGRADLARWVVLGFALGAPSLLVQFGFYYRTPVEVSGVVVTAVLATAAGIVLTLRADRLFAWDALGAAVTAVGMMIGSGHYTLQSRTPEIAFLVTIGGFAFALASGLTRAIRTTTGDAGQVALSLSLGFVALLATADAIGPASWVLLGTNGFNEFQLGPPITTLIGVGVLLLLFAFRRAGRARTIPL
ncbi:MAG TPA: hypothetical protein VFC19_24120 [Candidatus Limnocylindrales bacterium]|nr:hypothetical protein [Candidatus Limnocylindrales bacterium]